MLKFRRRRAEDVDARMTVVEHLTELRSRILKSFLAFVLGAIVAYAFYDPLFEFLTSPLDSAGRIGDVTVDKLFVPGITTAFNLRLKVSIFGGLFLALPVILWQLWRFIVPGLTGRERKYGVWFVIVSVALFCLGTFFAFLMLPQAISFLLSFISSGQEPLIQVTEYFSFLSLMVIAFGLSFEFPLLLLFLGALGIVSWRRLSSWRRQAIFGSFVVGAVATPSQDPLTMALLAAPLYILYEASILVLRYVMRK